MNQWCAACKFDTLTVGGVEVDLTPMQIVAGPDGSLRCWAPGLLSQPLPAGLTLVGGDGRIADPVKAGDAGRRPHAQTCSGEGVSKP